MSSRSSIPKYIVCDPSQIMTPKPRHIRKIKNRKEKIYKIPKKLNLNLISLNEIEEDFIKIKYINEQKELMKLIRKAKNCKNKNKNKTFDYLRPEKANFDDTNEIKLFI